MKNFIIRSYFLISLGLSLNLILLSMIDNRAILFIVYFGVFYSIIMIVLTFLIIVKSFTDSDVKDYINNFNLTTPIKSIFEMLDKN